jgi:hypothetical protein
MKRSSSEGDQVQDLITDQAVQFRRCRPNKTLRTSFDLLNVDHRPGTLGTAPSNERRRMTALSGEERRAIERACSIDRRRNPSDTLKAVSVPDLFSLARADAWRGVDMYDRRGFGITEPLFVFSHAPSDGGNHIFRQLAVRSAQSEEQRSLVPLYKFIPTLGGKIAVALGADVLTVGLSSNKKSFIAGGCLTLIMGVVGVVMGIYAFVGDMKKINPKRVRLTIALTAIGITTVAGGVVLGECDLGQKNLGIRSAAAIVFGAGLTVLNSSFPLCFAYSEVVHGDIIKTRRNEIIFALWGVGLGLATGLTLARGYPHDKTMPKSYPFGVAHFCAVLGISSAGLGTCLSATNQQRMHARVLELRARLKNKRVL